MEGRRIKTGQSRASFSSSCNINILFAYRGTVYRTYCQKLLVVGVLLPGHWLMGGPVLSLLDFF